MCCITLSDKSKVQEFAGWLDFCPCQIIFLSFCWKHKTSFAKLFLWIFFSTTFAFLLPCLIYLSVAQLLIYVHWDARYIPCKWYQLIFVTLNIVNRYSELCLCIKPSQIVINYTLRKMYSTVELSGKGRV